MSKYGYDFYKRIGSIGGKAPTEQRSEAGKNFKGFAVNIELARTAGQKGGRISKRRKKEQTWH